MAVALSRGSHVVSEQEKRTWSIPKQPGQRARSGGEEAYANDEKSFSRSDAVFAGG